MTGLAVNVAMATNMEESPSTLTLNQGHIVIFGIARIASPVIPPTHLPTATGVRKKFRSPSNGGTIAPIVVNRATGHVTVPIKRMTKRLFLEKVHGASPNRDLEPNRTIYVIVVAKRVTGHLSVPTRAAHKSGHGDLETERGLRTAIMIHGTAKDRARGSRDRRENSPEQRRQGSNSKDRSRSRSSAKPDDICRRCGGKGHHAKDCPTKL